MSTPIENNTEELQEILQTVNNLPNMGGSGFSIPVIDLEEFGFTEFTEDEIYSGNATWEAQVEADIIDQLKAKMEYGLVKLIMPNWETKYSITLLCYNRVSEESSEIWYIAHHVNMTDAISFEVNRNERVGNSIRLVYLYHEE